MHKKRVWQLPEAAQKPIYEPPRDGKWMSRDRLAEDDSKIQHIVDTMVYLIPTVFANFLYQPAGHFHPASGQPDLPEPDELSEKQQ